MVFYYFNSEQFAPHLNMEVYLIPCGNAARSWHKNPVQGTVTAIKRKYFTVTVKNGNDLRFYREDNTFFDEHETNNRFAVFSSLDRAKEAIRAADEFVEIRQVLSTLSFDSLSDFGFDKSHTIYKTITGGNP